MPDPLPSFARPPLIETVIGVQFAPIRGLSSAHLGLFWHELGTTWKLIGETEPVGQVQIESMQVAPWILRLAPPAGALRLKFGDATETRMLQLENGWLVYNWRRRNLDDEYPRFERLLPEFRDYLGRWRAFLGSHGLGELSANLWEVCYVNAIERGPLWQSPAEWSRVFPGLLGPPVVSHAGEVTSGAAQWRFPLTGTQGTLEITLDQVPADANRSEALRMMQLARGMLRDSNGIEPGLEHGHEVIVRTFAEVSSEAAHRHWGRIS